MAESGLLRDGGLKGMWGMESRCQSIILMWVVFCKPVGSPTMGTVPQLVSAGNQSMSDGLHSLLSPSIWQQTHVLTCWVHVMPDPSVRSGQKHSALRVYKGKLKLLLWEANRKTVN